MANDERDDIEAGTDERSIFQAYASALNNTNRVTHAEQAELLARYKAGDKAAFQQLWSQASKIVLFVLAKLKRSGRLPTVAYDDLDAIQEANVAVGLALPRWDPAKGTLAVWLVPTIRGTLLNYANTHDNMGIGSKHVSVVRVGMDEQVDSEEVSAAQDEPGMEQSVGITREDVLTYDDGVSPFTEAQRTELMERISKLPAAQAHVIREYYIEGHSLPEIAEKYGRSYQAMQQHLRAGELALKLQRAL